MRSCVYLLSVGVGLFLVGCGGSDSKATNGAGGSTSSAGGGNSGGVVSSGGASTCPAGHERCDCYGNHTCNDGLECRSNLCVSAAAGGNSSIGGTATGGAVSVGGSASGGVSAGGQSSGGAVSVGGSASGGVSAGGQSSGGGTDNGGMNTGGTGQGGVAAGGANATGGNAIAGSSASLGGSSSGGQSSVGGSSSIGGTSGKASTGGTPSATGGTVAVGGQSVIGGSAAITGGASSAGQSSTGGSTATTLCGNGIVDPGEGCDPLPHDNDLGDGCTPDCRVEPRCLKAGGPCLSVCGDGIVMNGEACDDGNVVSGDGCSADCQVEPGYTCAQPPLGDTMVVPMVVRDFNAGGDFEKGSAFATDLFYANQGLLENTLDSNGLKPVLAATTGTYNGTAGMASGIASAASFAQWYDDAAPAAGNTYHATLATSLRLFLNEGGTAYVNRFGTNGDGLTSASYVRTTTSSCGYVGQEDHDASGNPIPCTFCPVDTDISTPQCDPPYLTPCQTDKTLTICTTNGGTYFGAYRMDGNPLFFPADKLTPASPSATAQIPGNYNPSWPVDPTGVKHNFSFTTEIRFWFQYAASKPYTLTFAGDDDVWVFINKRLAVDLGGIHSPVLGTLAIEADTGTTTVTVTPTDVTPPTSIVTHPMLALEDGNIYEIAIFQAERQTTSSSYMLSLAGFNTASSVCTRQ